MNRHLLPTTAIFSVLMVSGCATQNADFQRPVLELPTAATIITPALTNTTPSMLSSYWHWIKDPVLENLLQEALRHNQDLALAAGRVEEVRAQLRLSNANRYPSVDASLGAARYPTVNGALDGVQIKSTSDAGQQSAYQLSLNATYEIDFWGKLHQANQAARARLLAEEANRGIVQSSLFASVVQHYFELRALDARLVLASTMRKTRQDFLALQQARADLGDIGPLQLQTAQLDLATADMALAQARQAVAHTESALALLLGRSPAAISAPQIARGAEIDALFAQQGIPLEFRSEVLNRRPDILAAEQQLRAAHADIAQAKAAYFPSIKLGMALTSAGDISNPGAILWNLGAGVAQAIFHGGRLDAGVAIADAKQTQALAHYVKSVQNAFRDVHDVLTNLQEYQQMYSAAHTRALIQAEALRLHAAQYEHGHSSQQALLDAQYELQKTQLAMIDSQRALLASRVNLLKAVGAGWEMPTALALN